MYLVLTLTGFDESYFEDLTNTYLQETCCDDTPFVEGLCPSCMKPPKRKKVKTTVFSLWYNSTKKCATIDGVTVSIVQQPTQQWHIKDHGESCYTPDISQQQDYTLKVALPIKEGDSMYELRARIEKIREKCSIEDSVFFDSIISL